MTKFKVTLTGVVLPFLLLFASPNLGSASSAIKKNQNRFSETGTLQKMIVENGSVTMQLDLNGLNGSGSLVARPVTLHFAAAPNSFFPILVFNDAVARARTRLDGAGFARVLFGRRQSAAKARRQDAASYNLPAALRASLKRLILEKLPSRQGFDLAVRDSDTGFTFFNVEGQQYDYDAGAQSFTITGGRLLLSKQFASTLGYSVRSWFIGRNNFHRRGDATDRNRPACEREAKSVVMPPMQHAVGPANAKPRGRPRCYSRRYRGRGTI